MSWSYSGDPEASKKDEVRFLIGDTDQSEPLLLDGEIRYLLRRYSESAIQASIQACETIMAKFGRLVDETVGSVSMKYSQRIAGYAQMRDELRQRLAIEDCTPFAGGIKKTQVKMTDLDPNRVKPDFTKHMMENHLIAPWVSGEGAGPNSDQDDLG